MTKENYDPNVIDDFGDEWATYDQSTVDQSELEKWLIDLIPQTSFSLLVYRSC